MEMTRQSFLTGMGLAAASAAGLGLAGPGTAQAEEAAGMVPVLDTSQAPFGYVSRFDWLGEAPDIDEAQIAETIETDVLVIGGGNAGIQAQLAAAEGGAKVDVVERKSAETRMVAAEDVAVVNAQWLIDRGFGPYDEGAIVEELSLRANGRYDTRILRRYVANSGEMFDHMVELVQWPDERIKLVNEANAQTSPLDPSQVVVQVPGSALDGPVEYPIVRGGYRSWAATVQFMGGIVHDTSEAGGVAALSRLDEFQQFAIVRAQELGATWHCGEVGVKLLTDEMGDVVGAITRRDADGAYVRYLTSKGVILATGDFSTNSDMVWNLMTEDVEWFMRAGGTIDGIMGRGNPGDGHKMGCWVGGAIEPAPRTRAAGFFPMGPWGMVPMLTLNALGERFGNECNVQASGAITRFQPVGIVAQITDANYATSVKLGANEHFSPNFGRVEYWDELQEDMAKVPIDGPDGYPVRCMYIAERNPAVVYGASTIEGLLGILGYEGEALQAALASIERYNELCEAGCDSDYGKEAICMVPIKEPPFYGCVQFAGRGSYLGFNTALAGLVTDDRFRVLRVQDGSYAAIGGLYAVGCTGTGHLIGGSTQCFAGCNLGMCMTSGRVAGKDITGQDIR